MSEPAGSGLKREADTIDSVAAAAQAPVQKAGKSKHNSVGSSAHSRSECIHHVELPNDWRDDRDIDEEKHGTLQHPHFDASSYAKEYPFRLDPFQATAVACIEREESVMVAAHTSAGKTVVAEYAIAKALARKQRVVYTSPLKALSNQKFRELSEEFGDVGLMTGDVTLNEDASCIVMTTEILRSMLYRGSEMMREIVWVIFDEIHYMQDRDRGVVWEETIIGLPRACRMAFLSATLANATEFAGWVAMLHGRPCHVVYTEFRPTPLEHFGLPCTEGSAEGRKGGLYKVFTKDGEFVTRMWEDLSAAGMLKEPWQDKCGGDAAAEDLTSKQSAAKPKRATGMVGERIADLMELVQQRKLYPIIVFSFNRLECETFAMDIFNRGGNSGGTALDFTTAEEKAHIDLIFTNAVEELGDDKDLAAVQKVRRFLARGIGFHHGGLLPLVKELVEILFQEGLVKVLFATETFAMGLNMPARTVLFTTYFKSDGVATRALSSGEYIQMSGRAGRRGKDARGYVILLIEDPDKFSPAVARALVAGTPMPLLSRFKLSYYTLLNLSKRREGGLDHMDYLIAHSFQQYQHDRQAPRLQARIDEIEAQLAAPEAAGLKVESFDEYVQLKEQRGVHAAAVQAAVMAKPAKVRPFLAPGRLVRVQEGSTDWGWGVVLKQPELKPIGGQEPGADTAAADKAASKVAANWQLPVMLAVSKTARASNTMLPAQLDSADAEMQALPVPMPLIVALAGQKLALDRDLRNDAAKRRVHDALKELVLARSGSADAVPTLHPVKDLGVKAAGVEAAMQQVEALDAQLRGSELMKQEGTKEAKLFRRLQDLAVERGGLKAAIAQSQLTDFREEVTKRRRVLLRLGHVTEEGLLTVKGKAAAEIDTADELMTTELMFNAVWQQLKAPALLVALLSCLVPCTEKERSSEPQVRLPLLLAQTYKTMQDFAERLAAISNECGIEVDAEQYGAGFTANLMVPLYTWARGATFAEVTSKTSIYEGTLVRCARRLVELMHQIIYAADKVGEAEMKAQVEAALACLQRGIMFTGSLYLSGS